MENYVNYDAALEMTGLEDLNTRREDKCLKFAQMCTKHPRHLKMFPLNPGHMKEKYKVNFARTVQYQNSAIPYMQRMLST